MEQTPLQIAVRKLYNSEMMTPLEADLIQAFIADPFSDDSLDAKLLVLENGVASLPAYKDKYLASMSVEIYTKLERLNKEIVAAGKKDQYKARLVAVYKGLMVDGFKIELPKGFDNEDSTSG